MLSAGPAGFIKLYPCKAWKALHWKIEAILKCYSWMTYSTVKWNCQVKIRSLLRLWSHGTGPKLNPAVWDRTEPGLFARERPSKKRLFTQQRYENYSQPIQREQATCFYGATYIGRSSVTSQNVTISAKCNINAICNNFWRKMWQSFNTICNNLWTQNVTISAVTRIVTTHRVTTLFLKYKQGNLSTLALLSYAKHSPVGQIIIMCVMCVPSRTCTCSSRIKVLKFHAPARKRQESKTTKFMLHVLCCSSVLQRNCFWGPRIFRFSSIPSSFLVYTQFSTEVLWGLHPHFI